MVGGGGGVWVDTVVTTSQSVSAIIGLARFRLYGIRAGF